MSFSIKRYFILVLMLLVIFSTLLSACQKTSKYLILGRINQNLYKEVNKFNFQNQEVYFASSGGENKYAVLLAKKFSKKTLVLE